MTLYLISQDDGKNWSQHLANDKTTKSIWLGKIDNYDPTKDYSSSDITIYRKFDLNGPIVVPSNIPVPTPTPTPVPTPIPTPTPTIPTLFTIDVFNFSDEKNEDIIKWCNAVKKQADKDVSKWWTYTIDFNFDTLTSNKAVPNHAYMGLFKNSEQAGVLGWHDVGQNNEPLIKIFTKESESFNLSPSGTISHEVVESICDANSVTTIQGVDEKGKSCLYYLEVADPVEGDLYQIDNIDVSDFVTPAWFKQLANGPFDFLGHVKNPFEILQGGYMQLSYDNGNTWTEINNFSKHAAKHESNGSRYALYKKPIEKRMKSKFIHGDDDKENEEEGENKHAAVETKVITSKDENADTKSRFDIVDNKPVNEFNDDAD